ncbi:MAG: outer membrane lipoprotein carrier protein LolA [Bacteroidales bacterium]|nr:outer membrane lipoprotein carrier protein LolA [Bacteroidales bacterium]
MNFKVIFLATAAMMSLSLTSLAQLKNANGNALVTKVQDANKSVSSIQCPFVRTTKVAALKDAATSNGTFYFQSPTNLCMKYADGELFVVTEDNVSMSVGGKARTLRSSNRHVEGLSSTLISCIRGQVSAIEGNLKSAKGSGQNIVFKIETDMKVGRNSITSIELTYAKKDCTLNTLKLIEADGSYTLYDLKEKTLNSSIDAKVFEHAVIKKRR